MDDRSKSWRIFAPKKRMNKKLNYEYCHAAPVLEWMGQKWALVTLLRMKEADDEAAQAGGIRFSDLYRTIPQISEKMLASTLDYLEQEGLVNRIAHATFPPHVTYSLTPLALNFLREISYVIEWGQLHYEEILQGRKTPHTR